MRNNQRKNNELRPIKITPDVVRNAEGSVQIEMGNTRLICTASIDPVIPKWLMGQGQGWVTAEYGMLPRSTHSRIQREKAAQGGRTQEISRLIGRSLRAAVDLKKLGERQVIIDCDVIQADGGTRTAAITGGFVALSLALNFLKDQGQLQNWPIKNQIAAISVGLSPDGALLDLDYNEDSSIETDMNFVMNDKGEFIEIQGTAESGSFNLMQLNQMVELAQSGCRQLFDEQKKFLKNL